ncbi:MAG TPA: glutathione S-transferase [Polyangiaceae bacterium]|nr:glutathione S-transferase [Polyangiaceae bacterium]
MKLFRLRYSPYARKVQMLLDLIPRRYESIEVSYGDRNELAELTSGYIYVPVLEDGGKVIVDSRRIAQHLLSDPNAAHLVPAPHQGPIWAYADFADGPLEDVLFRIASPFIRDQWQTPFERALYTLIKERKFGAGCLDAWAAQRDELFARGRELLEPTLLTLGQQPFLFGQSPTLADAALYGLCEMLEEAKPELLAQLSPRLPEYARRLERFAKERVR